MNETSNIIPLRQPDEELSPKLGDDRAGQATAGLTVSRLGDDLDSVIECHTENEFLQPVMSVKQSPAFLCALEQFEYQCERGPVGQAAFRIVR